MKRYIQWIAAAAIVGALAGCARTTPIDQVRTTLSAGHTENQVKNAILKAGAQRKWIMSEAGPGVIIARQQSHDHMAEVRITYTAHGYDIKYNSSLNLKASQGKIHKSYNRWVHNLDKDIQLKLSASADL